MAIPWEAIIGVGGTLLGTALGWWLGQSGRIIMRIKDLEYSFFKHSPYNKPCNYDECPDEIRVKFNLSVYNRKGVACSISDCKVSLQYRGERAIIDDDLFNYIDDVYNFDELMNIEAFSVTNVKYNKTRTLLPHSDKMKKGYKLYFQYRLNGGILIHKKRIRTITWKSRLINFKLKRTLNKIENAKRR